MRKRILIISVIIIWSLLLISIPFYMSEKDENDTSDNKFPSAVTLLNAQTDFTEEELDAFNKFLKEGYSFADALRLSNPDKYDELLNDYPESIQNLSETYSTDQKDD